jgi:hypothetical protein
MSKNVFDLYYFKAEPESFHAENQNIDSSYLKVLNMLQVDLLLQHTKNLEKKY